MNSAAMALSTRRRHAGFIEFLVSPQSLEDRWKWRRWVQTSPYYRLKWGIPFFLTRRLPNLYVPSNNKWMNTSVGNPGAIDEKRKRVTCRES